MKSGRWLKIATIAVCIIGCSPAVSADEPEPATEVAVQTGKIIKTTLHRYVMVYGMVEPEPAAGGKPAAGSKIAAPVAGILAQIHCEEGQRVKKGDLLFELDTRSADALIARAEVSVEFAQKNFARKQQLSATDNVSRKLYDEAELLLQTARKDLLTAQTQRELLLIKAPLSGTVAAIHFKVGEEVSPNAVFADLIDLDRLDIAMRVPSLEAATLRLGQPVEISAGPAESGVQPGKLAFIGPQVDPLTDTVLVRAAQPADSGLRPGQFVNARIVAGERPDRLAVPIESVVTRAGTSMIAIIEGDNAKLKAVKPGWRDGRLIEISGEGLQEGMAIVTQGVYGLPPETRIRVLK
ncbi:MAG: efflux RND transporter periplasmic adaptor subunit [Methylobacter sp.]|nr:efflux RND transporter periplasmic adaptor subunit [Methylobacter sp.]